MMFFINSILRAVIPYLSYFLIHFRSQFWKMSSICSIFSPSQRRPTNPFFPAKSMLFKSLAISGLILYIIYIIFSFSSPLITYLNLRRTNSHHHAKAVSFSPTNISHLAFGITSCSNTWRTRRYYVESWWQPNSTRGYLFLDRVRREFFPWPSSSPPFWISEDTSRYEQFNKHRTKQAIRMARMIVELFRAENKGVRWYILTDDDTIVFVDNLVDVLGKYDHREYLYVGANSDCISSNFFHSFEMAFGGGGYALSYPLAEALVKNMDVCIMRYPTLYGSDHILQSCAADLGVSLTQEKGFHQIDLHRDLSGFLSAHPQSPLLTLHHLDAVDPIFPSMDRKQSLHHLMKAAKADASRLLQQTVCHHRSENWTISISWGYSARIYDGFHSPSLLQRPLETFGAWSKAARPPFMFNTRIPSRNPCDAPHVFFFEYVEEAGGNHVFTSYSRKRIRRLPACRSNRRASLIDEVRVLSPTSKIIEAGIRRECCDIVQEFGMNATEVKIRACGEDELLA